MLTAFAYVIVCVVRIPIILFLKYEPKDVVITIGGFLYGPAAALMVSVAVSFLEMITISDTGWIGCIMNILSTCAFACTASYIYKKHHKLWGAVAGLFIGSLLATAVMLAWNYILTPLYMNQSRADIAAMLIPVFLPFNLIKSGLNTAITALLYRPLVKGLRRAGLFPKSVSSSTLDKNNKFLFYAGAMVLLILSIVAVYLFR